MSSEVTLTMHELLEFGNKCWWQSKEYWENHPSGEAPAKTINQIFEDFMEKKTKQQRMKEFEENGPIELQESIFDRPKEGMTVSESEKLAYYKTRYQQLIGAVESKFPGESRHETALRYISQAESNHRFGGPCEDTDS